MSFSEPLSIESVLAECPAAIEADPEGTLPWSWRVRLWDAFNRSFPRDSILRRQVLAFLVARETLSAFSAVADRIPTSMRDLPRGFLRDTQLLLRAEVTSPATKINHFEDDIENAMALYEMGNGVYSIIATYSALPDEVMRREHIYREHEYSKIWSDDYNLTEADDEWTAWETHYWGAVVAGGSIGTDAFNIKDHRTFWYNWVNVSIPSVLGEIQSVLLLLHDG